jgi:hypothetical protein
VTSQQLEGKIGHPESLRDNLVARVQDRAIKRFSDVQDEWMALMWSLDAFRVAGISPSGMGKGGASGFEGVYRSKGNWFALLLSLLIENQTGQLVGSRTERLVESS